MNHGVRFRLAGKAVESSAALFSLDDNTMTSTSHRLPALRSLAVPSVCILICFLAYSSQYLFRHLDPGPLTAREAVWFNLLVAGTWWSYERACRVNPGELPGRISDASLEACPSPDAIAEEHMPNAAATTPRARSRWCKKCEAVKPPRAHHCRQCGRCIPKMDHHCPWTSNCVSHTTFPHFLRFIYFTCASLFTLAYYLSIRIYAVYSARNLPSYLGPSMWALAHLLMLTSATSLLLFALTILLVTATRSLLMNITMIESWEIERHEALVEKARYLGGYVYGPGGRRVRIRQQEFPYDIGIWKNLVQGMGGSNFVAWVLPFAGGPGNDSGWGPWEENGFEDEGTHWPPVDPDKMTRAPAQERPQQSQDAFIHADNDEVRAFKMRQQEDYKRWESMRQSSPRPGTRLRSSAATEPLDGDESLEGEDEDEECSSDYEEGMDGEPGWTNSDGDRLRDYGVDEAAELILEDDIPLGELLRRRRRRAAAADAEAD